jgi:hypothetical protein
MRHAFLILTALAVSPASLGQTAIGLSPALGSKGLITTKTDNFVGSCGKAAVMVFGVSGYVEDTFTIEGEAAKVIVRVPRSMSTSTSNQLVLFPGNGVLSDYNGIACISARGTNKLLIWSDCAGSACGRGFSFFVIDPEKPVMIMPKNPKDGSCNYECATREIGSKLPAHIKAH